jgi:ATP-dependent RNA helicase DeaD
MNYFSDSGLRSELLSGIAALGFETPTPIQARSIPPLLTSDRDLIALAQTGTGKTAAFGLPILQRTDPNDNRVQAIILCPTRELCLQIAKDLRQYASELPELKVLPVYGGTPVAGQVKSLRRQPQIIVGTPGRTLDLIDRGYLDLSGVRRLVLDEADEMLNMGFQEDLDRILATTPAGKQTLLFSATMPPAARRIARDYMRDPLEINLGGGNTAPPRVTHACVVVKGHDRYRALKRLLDAVPDIYAVIFCRTRRETQQVADELLKDGYRADALHGDLAQGQRDYVMGRFRRNHLQLLVATDVAARGLDVDDLTHVIHYQLPDSSEVYLHRSGRTGRAGKEGTSIAIITGRQTRRLHELEKAANVRFEERPVPTGRDICEKHLFHFIDRVEHTTIDEPEIEALLPIVRKKLSWLDRDELIRRFVAVEFRDILAYYRETPDLTTPAAATVKGPRKSVRFTRFFINLGEKQKLSVGQLIGVINEQTGQRDIPIGKIEMLRNFSFVEIDSDYEELVLSSFRNAQAHGVDLKVEVSNPDPHQQQRQVKKERQRAKYSRSTGGPKPGRKKQGKSRGKNKRS